jgi:hypothetical protein
MDTGESIRNKNGKTTKKLVVYFEIRENFVDQEKQPITYDETIQENSLLTKGKMS